MCIKDILEVLVINILTLIIFLALSAQFVTDHHG